MQANKSKDTKPELIMTRALKDWGFREGKDFTRDMKLDMSGISPVKPDFVLHPHGLLKLALFIDGCYWHFCPEHHSSPKTNVEFWAAKFTGNARRDERNNFELVNLAGITVYRAWECRVKADAENVAFLVTNAAMRPGDRPRVVKLRPSL